METVTVSALRHRSALHETGAADGVVDENFPLIADLPRRPPGRVRHDEGPCAEHHMATTWPTPHWALTLACPRGARGRPARLILQHGDGRTR
jgi:hypothetical protein